ncbi:beta-ketoacyl synthase N-terminal-like domain-containing protein [Streptomyces seoulensis]|uniref:beta-ketoacyl synthase N-terminal-like domain-containing protein n=1 Tax=Streptomyces seoulensis TaxID=73044 RepID=UPI003665CDDF
MSCRLPHAENPAQLWRLLREGRSAIGAPRTALPAGGLSGGRERLRGGLLRRQPA